MEEVEGAIGFAQWFESKTNIVSLVLGIVCVAQFWLGFYRDKRHKAICFELGEVWIKETQRWAREQESWSKRIDQMWVDNKEAFDLVRSEASRSADIREKIAAALTQYAENVRTLSASVDSLAREVRDVMRMRDGR